MTGGAGPRRKGSDWEREVRDYLRSRLWTADRRYGAGRPDDVADLVIGGWVPMVAECKAANAPRRGAWIDALLAKVPRPTSPADPHPILIEKRRGRGDAGDGFVTLDLRGFCDLIEAVARRVGDLDERSLP